VDRLQLANRNIQLLNRGFMSPASDVFMTNVNLTIPSRRIENDPVPGFCPFRRKPSKTAVFSVAIASLFWLFSTSL
jgi:hypothetical protein